MHGVYLTSEGPITLPIRAAAALEFGPEGAALSHHTAAVLWGGVVPDTSNVHVRIRPDQRLRRRGVVAHRFQATEAPATRLGMPVTSPTRTFLDLAGHLDLVDLVVLGDSLVAAGVVTVRQLVEATQGAGIRNIRSARRAARYVRDGVDSPAETRLRMLIVLAGLPEPEVNHVLRMDDGSWRRRFDLSFPHLRLAIEYDGRQHAESTDQWERDIDRREELDGLGWRVVVVIGRHLWSDPARVLVRIVQAMNDLGAGTSVTSQEWRAHFPGRASRI